MCHTIAVAIAVVSIGLLCWILVAIITMLGGRAATPAVQFLEERRHGRYAAALILDALYVLMGEASGGRLDV
jgi:hypothetical protein